MKMDDILVLVTKLIVCFIMGTSPPCMLSKEVIGAINLFLL